MGLKLRAEDAEDLKVISAHVQDALMRVGDIAYLPRHRRLALSLNRFCWEQEPSKIAGKTAYARITSGLHADSVLSVKARGLDRKNSEGLLYLLAIEPRLGPDGAGTVEFVFAGGASLLADVECVDVSLADRGEPWFSESLPEHKDTEASAAR